jgi:hypothetical protein
MDIPGQGSPQKFIYTFFSFLYTFFFKFIYTWPRLAAEIHRAEAAADAAGAAEARLCLLRQYLYFCTSKASKLSTVRIGCVVHDFADEHQDRQQLPSSWAGRAGCVSICCMRTYADVCGRMLTCRLPGLEERAASVFVLLY